MSDSGQIQASSLVRALNVVGDAWTVLILKEAFLGVRRFNEFQESLGIPRQTLALRLAALADHHILYKRPTLHRTIVQEYRLTPKGLDLYDFIMSVWAWHKRWDIGNTFLPGELLHKPCGHTLDVRLVCRECGDPVVRADIRTEPGEGSGFDPKPAARHSRMNDAAFSKSTGVEPSRMVATTVVGDRWSNLDLDAIFRAGADRFRQRGAPDRLFRHRARRGAVRRVPQPHRLGRPLDVGQQRRAAGARPRLRQRAGRALCLRPLRHDGARLGRRSSPIGVTATAGCRNAPHPAAGRPGPVRTRPSARRRQRRWRGTRRPTSASGRALPSSGGPCGRSRRCSR